MSLHRLPPERLQKPFEDLDEVERMVVQAVELHEARRRLMRKTEGQIDAGRQNQSAGY